NNEAEVARLRSTLRDAIVAIQKSDNDEALSILNRHLEKLGDVSNLSTPVEGLVFIYKGNAYKFTGAFAPAHQIISLLTYGRKGITFAAPTTQVGKAVVGVSPITAAELKYVWPELEG